MIKALDLSEIFCTFILSAKYPIAKKIFKFFQTSTKNENKFKHTNFLINMQKCAPAEKSYVEDKGQFNDKYIWYTHWNSLDLNQPLNSLHVDTAAGHWGGFPDWWLFCFLCRLGGATLAPHFVVAPRTRGAALCLNLTSCFIENVSHYCKTKPFLPCSTLITLYIGLFLPCNIYCPVLVVKDFALF